MKTLLVVISIAVAMYPTIGLSRGLSDTEAAFIRCLGALSALGDTLQIRAISIIRNESAQATPPDRTIDAALTKSMIDEISASERIKGDIAGLATTVTDIGSIVAEPPSRRARL